MRFPRYRGTTSVVGSNPVTSKSALSRKTAPIGSPSDWSRCRPRSEPARYIAELQPAEPTAVRGAGLRPVRPKLHRAVSEMLHDPSTAMPRPSNSRVSC